MTFSDLLRTLAQSIATFVEAIGVAIVAVGVVLACYRYLAGLRHARVRFRRRDCGLHWVDRWPSRWNFCSADSGRQCGQPRRG